MGYMRYIIMCTVFLAISVNSFAGWKLVHDPWTTAQVTANAGEQKFIEDQHNQRLDTLSDKQQKIAKYTATMEGIKELYRISMQNTSGFGNETVYYREICSLSLDIMMGIPTVTKFVTSNPVKNYVLCLTELSDIMLETEGLVCDFVNIVNNGKVRNPLNKNKKDDGYNFMDRYTRISLANRIYTRLLDIKYKMDVMVMMCKFGTWGDVFFALDPVSWAAVFQGTYLVDGLINDWNSLGV